MQCEGFFVTGSARLQTRSAARRIVRCDLRLRFASAFAKDSADKSTNLSSESCGAAKEDARLETRAPSAVGFRPAVSIFRLLSPLLFWKPPETALQPAEDGETDGAVLAS
jgi:hypothetical protein